MERSNMFIGLLPPAPWQDVLEHIQRLLDPSDSGPFNLIKRSRLHLSIRKVKSVERGHEKLLIYKMRCAAELCDPFELQLGQLSQFGRATGVPYIWAGVRGDIARLHNVRDRVEDIFTGPKSRRGVFTPHITLARPRPDADAGVANQWRDALAHARVPDAAPYLVDELVLIRSTGSSDAQDYEYEVVATARLGGAPTDLC
jgi:2'-5' RNA ligase